jgi:ABC-type thiamine transport system ATPase subunit
VFQSYALYPHKTVYENIAFGLRMRKVESAEIDRRVRDAAAKLEIDHLLQRRPSQLSGGQRQRVALGRAMVRQPAVFLMDEPLSNLDAALRISMRAEIKHLHTAMQTTFVYLTHLCPAQSRNQLCGGDYRARERRTAAPLRVAGDCPVREICRRAARPGRAGGGARAAPRGRLRR